MSLQWTKWTTGYVAMSVIFLIVPFISSDAGRGANQDRSPGGGRQDISGENST